MKTDTGKGMTFRSKDEGKNMSVEGVVATATT